MKDDFLKKLQDIDNGVRYESENKMASRFKKVFGESVNPLFMAQDDLSRYVEIISAAKKTDGFVARTLNQITQKALKSGWTFDSKNAKNTAVISDRFESLIIDSNLTVRSFLRDLIKNCVSYSNAFVLKTYEKDSFGKDKKIAKLTLLPSVGWTPKETSGPLVTKWGFSRSTSGATEYSSKDVIHFYLNKETHEIFGIPFIISVLEDLQLKRDLEGKAAENYFNFSNQRTFFKVGTPTQPASDKEVNTLTATLETLEEDDDLVLNGRIEPGILKTDFKEPTGILTTLNERIFAGLMMSSSGMGISGAGRQDADTQSSKETVTVEDFQEAIEDIINNTILRELCLEEFGGFKPSTMVTFKFVNNFDQQERKNNHWLNQYQSGTIDFDEMRNKIGEPSYKFNAKKSFLNDKHQREIEKIKIAATVKPVTEKVSGTAQSKTTPSNQHGTKTGSTPSKKN